MLSKRDSSQFKKYAALAPFLPDLLDSRTPCHGFFPVAEIPVETHRLEQQCRVKRGGEKETRDILLLIWTLLHSLCSSSSQLPQKVTEPERAEAGHFFAGQG